MPKRYSKGLYIPLTAVQHQDLRDYAEGYDVPLGTAGRMLLVKQLRWVRFDDWRRLTGGKGRRKRDVSFDEYMKRIRRDLKDKYEVPKLDIKRAEPSERF